MFWRIGLSEKFPKNRKMKKRRALQTQKEKCDTRLFIWCIDSTDVNVAVIDQPNFYTEDGKTKLSKQIKTKKENNKINIS